MSTTTSIVTTVANALHAQLETALAGKADNGGNPVIVDGFGAEYSSWDTVVIGDQVNGKHEYNNMRAGRKPRTENYTQHVWFRVIRTGGGSAAARDAAIEQLAVLEDLIADDPKLGLAEPTLVLNVAGFQCNAVTDASSGGWLSTIRADVSVFVRLT